VPGCIWRNKCFGAGAGHVSQITEDWDQYAIGWMDREMKIHFESGKTVQGYTNPSTACERTGLHEFLVLLSTVSS
jgi:hypothetical protein